MTRTRNTNANGDDRERTLENQHDGMTRRASRRSYVGDVMVRTTSVKNTRA